MTFEISLLKDGDLSFVGVTSQIFIDFVQILGICIAGICVCKMGVYVCMFEGLHVCVRSNLLFRDSVLVGISLL